MKNSKTFQNGEQKQSKLEFLHNDIINQNQNMHDTVFQNIIKSTKEPIFIIGLDGKFKFISPQYRELLNGIKINLETNIFEYIHPDDVNNLISLFKKGLKEKKPAIDENIEFRLKQKNNNYIWVSSSTKNYYNNEGKLIGFISTLRDVTKQKLKEQKLEESLKHFRSIVEQTPLEIYIFQEGQIKYINKQDITISEYFAKEILNWSKADIKKVIHPDDLNSLLDQQKKQAAERTDIYFNKILRIFTKSGKIKWIEISLKQISYHGKPASLITLKKASDRKLIKESTKEFKVKGDLTLKNFEEIKDSLNGLCLLLNMAYDHHDIYLWSGIENLYKLYQKIVELLLDENGLKKSKQIIQKTKIDLDINNNDEVYFKFS